MKKVMKESLPDAIPFNEDMSVGTYHHVPFSEEFIKERSKTHNVTVEAYKQNLSSFISLLANLQPSDELHLYFGEDKTCLANREFVIKLLKGRVTSITLHIVDELTGKEIEEPLIYG